MKHEERLENLWHAFWHPLPPPTPQQTEAFIHRVLSRLPEETPWYAASLRWLVPALSFAMAASLLLIAWPRSERLSPLEETVQAGWSQPTIATADDLLALLMEEK